MVNVNIPYGEGLPNGAVLIDGKTNMTNIPLEMGKPKKEFVNHPSHYQSKKGIEVIDVMEAFTENLSGIEAVDTAQVIKYICRWKDKDGVQDLRKCAWYIDHLINHIEKGE